MLVSYTQALQIYEALPDDIRAPGLHPYYVVTDALRDSALRPFFWVFSDGRDTYYHAFHLSAIPSLPGWSDIQSPYGYGGPVATTLSSSFLSAAHHCFSEWCQENNVLVEFIRFHPVLRNERFFRGKTLTDRQTVVVDLDADYKAGYSKRVKYKLKNSGRSLSISVKKTEETSAEFQSIYNTTMQRLSADQSYFFPEAYYSQIFAWEKTLCVTVYQLETARSSALFLVDGNLIEYHLSGADEIGQKLDATTITLDHIASLGKELKARQLHLGGGTDANPQNSLFFFKQGFSKTTTSFVIGSCIHEKRLYETYKQHFFTSAPKNNKILFYRFTN